MNLEFAAKIDIFQLQLYLYIYIFILHKYLYLAGQIKEDLHFWLGLFICSKLLDYNKISILRNNNDKIFSPRNY